MSMPSDVTYRIHILVASVLSTWFVRIWLLPGGSVEMLLKVYS